MKNNTQMLKEMLAQMHYSATETLFWSLSDVYTLNGYNEDGEDEDGEDAYSNCEVTITIKHKGETISN